MVTSKYPISIKIIKRHSQLIGQQEQSIYNLYFRIMQPFQKGQDKPDLKEQLVQSELPQIRPRARWNRALQETIRMKNSEINGSKIEGSDITEMPSLRRISTIIRRVSGFGNHCQICEEDVKTNKEMFIAACKHKGYFCESCLQHYSVYTIEQFGRVRCPSSGCEKEMNVEGAFFRSLPANIQIKYRKAHRFYSTIENPTLKMCPREDCEGLMKVEKGAEKVNCSTCGSEFCPYCFFAIHVGVCDEFELQFFQQTLHYRQCPRCKMVIDKFQGCNHMTCICKHEFCYVCSADWTTEHYQNHDQNGRFFPPPVFVPYQQPPPSLAYQIFFYSTLIFRLAIGLILLGILSVPFFILFFTALFALPFLYLNNWRNHYWLSNAASIFFACVKFVLRYFFLRY